MPSTALVMIVRDEMRCIERCLASVRPWVDAMVVVDTGSRDATPALAAAAGAEVHAFDWVDDFAAARNAALARSAADWNLVLDADEALVDGGPWLAALREVEPGFIGRVDVHSDFDDAGAVRTANTRISRLLPRGARYEGRIHEQPIGPWPRHDVPLRLVHDGYRDAALERKRDRNRVLLERALAHSPDDPYLHHQLGKEHSVYGAWAPAAEHFARAHARRPPDAGWRFDLLARWLFALKRLGRHEDGLHLAAAESEALEISPDVSFALGDLLLDWAACEPRRAGELLPMAEAAWRRCLAIGERPELDGAVHGRGGALAEHNLRLVGAFLADPQHAAALAATAL